MNWSVLGIEETKNKKAITKAYREKLIHTNPEDKPEEFKALRAAYEEALALADQAEEPAEKPQEGQAESGQTLTRQAENGQPQDEKSQGETPQKEKTPLEIWTQELENLYNDFQARISVGAWKKLLSEDICQALDTRPDAEQVMLHFFMEHYLIPHKVWVYLDKEFSFLERIQELYEKYPKNFIDYVIVNGVRNRDAVPFDLFVPGTDAAGCDEFLKLFPEITSKQMKDAGEEIARMEAISEYHPYKEALSLQYKAAEGGQDQTEKLKDLCDKYPDDTWLLNTYTDQCFKTEKWAETESAAKRLLSIGGNKFSAGWYLANALAEQKKYAKAAEQINELIRLTAGDVKIVEALHEKRKLWNEKLIAEYQKALSENPEDHEARLNLTWCYFQNEMQKETEDCIKDIPEDQPNPFDYHNLFCTVRVLEGKSQEALDHNAKVLKTLDNMQDDGTEETRKKLKRIPEMTARRGLILTELGKLQEAWECFDQALMMAPSGADILDQYVKARMKAKDYEGALPIAEKYCECRPGSYDPHFQLALICKMLHNDRDAALEADKALRCDPSYLSAYELKLIVFIRNGAFREAHELIDLLDQNKIGDYLSVRWCRAWLENAENRNQADKEKILSAYAGVDAELEKSGRDYHWLPEFYYQYACLSADDNDSRKIYERQILIDILDKGLRSNPDDVPCLDYKAWLLKKDNRYFEAQAIYEKLVRRPHRGVRAERELAPVYYMNLAENADKALKLYELLIEQDEQADDHFYAGMCEFTMGHLAGAEKHFLREQEMAPDDMDGYLRMSFVYEAMRRFPEALVQIDKAIDMVRNRNQNYSGHFVQKAAILRRMGRPDEAAKAILEAKEIYKDKFQEHPYLAGIYMQYGDFKSAENILSLWKKSTPNVLGNPYESKRVAMYCRWYLLQKKFIKGKISFINYRAAMPRAAACELAGVVGSVSGSASEYLDNCIEEYRLMTEKKRPEDVKVTLNLAEALWLRGRREESLKYAQIALEQLDTFVREFHRDKALYVTKRAKALFLLGRNAEAESELKKAAGLPMCEKCPYQACKDIDIFRVFGLIVQDRKKEALQLIAECQKRWPDELDFIFYENLLKKGK